MASVNEEHIEARIGEINDAVQTLRILTARGFDELTVYERLSMRYLVIQAVESASSICLHILVGSFDERAEGFPECFARLAVKGVIPEALALRMSSAARLRNLLVHRYCVISDEKVYESVGEGLEDFKVFIRHIREFLSGGAIRGCV